MVKYSLFKLFGLVFPADLIRHVAECPPCVTVANANDACSVTVAFSTEEGRKLSSASAELAHFGGFDFEVGTVTHFGNVHSLF